MASKNRNLRCWACDSTDTVFKGKTFMGGKKFVCSNCGFFNHTGVTIVDWVILFVVIAVNVALVLWALTKGLSLVPNAIGILVFIAIVYNFVFYNKTILVAAARRHKRMMAGEKCGPPVESVVLRVIGIFLTIVSALCGIALIFALAVPQLAFRLDPDTMTGVLCSFVVIGAFSCVTGIWLLLRSRFLAKNASKSQ